MPFLIIIIPIAAFFVFLEAMSNYLDIGMWQAFFLMVAGSFGLFLLAMLVGYWTADQSTQGGPEMFGWFRGNASENYTPSPQPKPLQPHERPPGWIGFRHKGMCFEFQRVKVGNEVRAYILSHPSYGSRSLGGHDTHRWYDSTYKLHYVCTGWPPETFEEAKEWARVWCRYTEHYIRTGKALT
jgi:hypothetical protein